VINFDWKHIHRDLWLVAPWKYERLDKVCGKCRPSFLKGGKGHDFLFPETPGSSANLEERSDSPLDLELDSKIGHRLWLKECNRCGGQGYIRTLFFKHNCPSCAGQGRVEFCPHCIRAEILGAIGSRSCTMCGGPMAVSPCWDCLGEGHVHQRSSERECKGCHGRGYVERCESCIAKAESEWRERLLEGQGKFHGLLSKSILMPGPPMARCPHCGGMGSVPRFEPQVIGMPDSPLIFRRGRCPTCRGKKVVRL
jgi:hypothetical protein